MKSKVHNPYPQTDNLFRNGMDFIIANINSEVSKDITFDRLNMELVDYFKTIFTSNRNDSNESTSSEYFSPLLQNIALSILPNTANNYQNSNLNLEGFYNKKQNILLNSIYDSIRSNEIEGIPTVLENANEEIARSGLSSADQAPLFIAVEVAKSSFQYWLTNFYNKESKWVKYLNENVAINIANLPFWIITSMEGALNGFVQMQNIDTGIETDMNSISGSIASIVAVISAVGLSSGKIFFKWVKPINSNLLNLNKETVSLFNNDMPANQQATFTFFCTTTLITATLCSMIANCDVNSVKRCNA